MKNKWTYTIEHTKNKAKNKVIFTNGINTFCCIKNKIDTAELNRFCSLLGKMSGISELSSNDLKEELNISLRKNKLYQRLIDDISELHFSNGESWEDIQTTILSMINKTINKL